VVYSYHFHLDCRTFGANFVYCNRSNTSWATLIVLFSTTVVIGTSSHYISHRIACCLDLEFIAIHFAPFDSYSTTLATMTVLRYCKSTVTSRRPLDVDGTMSKHFDTLSCGPQILSPAWALCPVYMSMGTQKRAIDSGDEGVCILGTRLQLRIRDTLMR
jgi:hypothetical protein